MAPSLPHELIDAWRARAAAREGAERAHRAAVRAMLPGAVRVLVERFGARRVVLFGSLARETSRETSDVDLLVEGIALDRLGDAHVAVLDALPGVWVDLVPAERARPEVLARAELEGETLHAL